MFSKASPVRIVIVACVVLFARAALAEDRPAVKEYNLGDDRVAIQGYSPVSYFESGKPEKGDPKFAVTYGGVMYHFTSAKQLESFNADPAKYEPAYGGWCAYGAAVNKKFPIDPANFKIVNGRLMLFLKSWTTDALEKWNKGDEQQEVQSADKFWHGLTSE